MTMTRTEMKLLDATTQLRLAIANSGNDEIVRSCINSFIEAARSVTLQMQAESSGALADWYWARLARLNSSSVVPLLRFFNETRAQTIHRCVIVPERVAAQISDFGMSGLMASSQATMISYRFEGIEEYIAGDGGGVFRVCEKYLLILNALFLEWQNVRLQLKAG
jgi:hypothetical protein